ncbi:hypothetical protein [Enterobacter sp. 22325]|uniref:hypothetical protein n=1 Tax=Enterobacter sp. 22325 TaxID=3453911 RepID=UPI003F857A42
MSLRKVLFSEQGSLAPLWAIGGLMLVISIFWAENYSWTFLNKYRQLQLTNSLARASLLENAGSSGNLKKLVEASGGNAAKQTFSQVANISTVVELNTLPKEKRLAEPLTVQLKSMATLDMPFTAVNKNLGLPDSEPLVTRDQSVKVFRPLNVILAIESSQFNKSSMARVITPLSNALQRLSDAAQTSRFTIIPYSYRINVSGKCYSGIERGDDFNFMWWENFFAADDAQTSSLNSLDTAKIKLANANSSISSKKLEVTRLNEEQKEFDVSSQEYKEIQDKIDLLKSEINDLQNDLPQLKENVNNAQKNNDEKKAIVDNLKSSVQYADYLALAKHYAKRYSNYKYFADYNDVFANSGIYSITSDNYLSAAKKLTASPEYLSQLAVTRNKYFGDTTTCPSSQVRYNLTSVSTVRNTLNDIDFSGTETLSLEGIIWAGRSVYGKSSSLIRNVVFIFISDKDEMNDPTTLPGVSNACSTLKNAFSNKIASKLVVVGSDSRSIEKFTHLSCPTTWYQDVGVIALDELNGNFSEELEARFAFYLSQESTTKNVNPK